METNNVFQDGHFFLNVNHTSRLSAPFFFSRPAVKNFTIISIYLPTGSANDLEAKKVESSYLRLDIFISNILSLENEDLF
jgi:hypothetical protein